MTKEEYVLLYEKCASGTCTERERKLLEEYKDEFSLDSIPWNEADLGNREAVTGRIYERLRRNMGTQQRSRRFRYHVPAAAAVLLLIVASYGLYRYLERPAKETSAASQIHSENDISPGGNRAILTLADGSKIPLDGSGNGVLADQEGIVIRKTGEGQVMYDLSGPLQPEPKEKTVAYNTITTPRGGQYQVILPDGSKVWLNAASSLRFPALFQGKERKVELTGEAYFEVAKKKDQAFVVATGRETIQVLGTHFNVSSYADESLSRTTLIEGSVKVSLSGHQAKTVSRILVPGQQSITEAGGLKVLAVNSLEAVAWKNGEFMFNNESIENVMKQIARWYDVEIVYPPSFEKTSIWGSVSRFENISEVLRVIELTGSVRFKIEGRRIYVMN